MIFETPLRYDELTAETVKLILRAHTPASQVVLGLHSLSLRHIIKGS